MKILIVGMGSIGTRHYKLIQKYYPEHEIESFTALGRNWDEVKKKKFDVGFICSPTHLHIIHAMRMADQGMAIFMEKPLDCSAKNLERLVALVEEKKLTTYLAYPFRHHPDIRLVKRLITDRNIRRSYIECTCHIEDWVKEYSRNIETGGGALLELSHEIDLAEYLFGKIVQVWGGAGKDRNEFINAETWASLRVEHESGDSTGIELGLLGDLDEYLRYVNIEGEDFHITYYHQPTEEMWLNQLKYFFDNIDNPDMDNSIPNAAGLFRRIIEFREEAYAKNN